MKSGAFDRRLLADFPFHAGDDVFVRMELAAEPVEFASSGIVGPTIAVDQEDTMAIGREDVAKRGKDGE